MESYRSGSASLLSTTDSQRPMGQLLATARSRLRFYPYPGTLLLTLTKIVVHPIIAFMDMMLAPTAISPLLGVSIAGRMSFQTNFLISILFGPLTLYYAYRLGEPRNKQLYKGLNLDLPESAPKSHA